MRSSLLALALLASACGSGVHDLSLPLQRLGTVKGRVDPTALAAKRSGTPLRAAIVWGAVPEYDYLCGDWADKNETLKNTCADPLRFVVSELQSSTAITLGADGSFELPIMTLPSASVAVGTAKGRVSYASLVVSEERPQQDPGSGPGIFDGRLPETILAASFISLAKPQQRLVFREGAFDAGSFFYPAPGCDAPPVGFSVLKASAYAAEPPYGACESASLQTPLELSILEGEEATRYQCRGAQTFMMEPRDDDFGTPDLTQLQCLDHEHAFIAQADPCRMLTYIPLKGCWNDPECEKPDWDLRSHPPRWWPC